MGFLNLKLSDLKERQSVPNGRYRLTIASYEYGESREKKSPQYKITINIDGHDEAMPVNHYMSIPWEKDTPEQSEFKSLLVKRFLVLFKVPHTDDGFDPDEMIGASADAELQLGEPNKSGDSYNNLVVPKLQDEGAGGAVGRANSASAAAAQGGKRKRA